MARHNHYPNANEADIALLMEGTYPFVRGGVSNWTQQIISAFPHYRFAIIFLGGRSDQHTALRYEMPDNVVHLETHYLFEPKKTGKRRPRKISDETYENIATLHEWFRQPDMDTFEQTKKMLRYYEEGKHNITYDQFLHSDGAWEHICAVFDYYCTDPSFIDYFWNVRNMHLPLWAVGDIVENMPKVKVVHAISTGYAGYLGSLLTFHYHYPLILSEHGIYTKERRIDMIKGQWIQDNRNPFLRDSSATCYYKALWIRFFESLAKICYEAADPIISLFGGSQDLQRLAGAPEEKLHIIPNGINVEELRPLREKRHPDNPKVVCLLARVVPIKDIKTFIHAMHRVINEIADAEAWIVGPETEDKAYSLACRALVVKMGLAHKIKFLGQQAVSDIFYKVRLLVLSSISEGLPLALLEACAAGVPAVTTDVGACRELIFGRSEEDKALGACGDTVNIADPVALSRAISPFLKDDDLWAKAQQVAITRVEKFYDLSRMIGAYRQVYQKAFDS